MAEFIRVDWLAFIAAGLRFGLGVLGLEIRVTVVGAAATLLAWFGNGEGERERKVFDVVCGLASCFVGSFGLLVGGVVDGLASRALAV